MNLYCRLISSTRDRGVYAAGSSPNDLNGIVIFFRQDIPPEVVREWEPYFSQHKANCLNLRYRSSFGSGIFSERVSREIG